VNAPLDNLILEVLDKHQHQSEQGTWGICGCGHTVAFADDHRVHLATVIADAVEENKRLVVPLPDPEDHATKSRDYGRGFADAIRRTKELLDEENSFAWTHGHARDPGPEDGGS
jgi:hypothetical protein